MLDSAINSRATVSLVCLPFGGGVCSSAPRLWYMAKAHAGSCLRHEGIACGQRTHFLGAQAFLLPLRPPFPNSENPHIGGKCKKREGPGRSCQTCWKSLATVAGLGPRFSRQQFEVQHFGNLRCRLRGRRGTLLDWCSVLVTVEFVAGAALLSSHGLRSTLQLLERALWKSHWHA